MRIRPLRPSSAHYDEPITMPDPPEVMRAAVFDAPGPAATLHEASVPVPIPVLSEVLVRVVAAGINPIDAKTRSGAGVSAAIGSYPAVLGYDFSGVVVRSPYESHAFPPGTEVFGMLPFPRTQGSYAEYAVVPTLSIARKPSSLSHVEAAGELPPQTITLIEGLIKEAADKLNSTKGVPAGTKSSVDPSNAINPFDPRVHKLWAEALKAAGRAEEGEREEMIFQQLVMP